MPTALLVGAYGQGALGDDALLDAFTVGLPGWRIVATALDPSTLTASCESVPRRVAPVLRQALRSDAVVFGGGTLFKRLHPSTGRHPLGLLASGAALTAAAALTRRPVALLGVGAATVSGRTAAALTRQMIKQSHLLVLRDEESAAMLVGAGAPGPFRVGADASWVLLEPPLSAHGGGDSVIVIPSRHAAGTSGQLSTDEMVERLERTLRQLIGAGMSVELRSFERPCSPNTPRGERAPRDDALVAALAHRLGSSVRVGPTPSTLAEAAAAMRSAAAVLTYRFHGLVAAAAAGVPAVAVAHEPKLAGLAARLRQRAVPPDLDAAALAQTVVGATASEGPEPAAVKHEIAKAEEGFRLLRVLLARGKSDESDEIGALPLRQWQ